jgi:hypothetical protein
MPALDSPVMGAFAMLFTNGAAGSATAREGEQDATGSAEAAAEANP